MVPTVAGVQQGPFRFRSLPLTGFTTFYAFATIRYHQEGGSPRLQRQVTKNYLSRLSYLNACVMCEMCSTQSNPLLYELA
jgi:hypothetical protein